MRILPVAFAAAALIFVACAAHPRSASAPLRVASDLKNPPFADLDASGVAVGRDVEMMEALGAELGRPIEWVRMPFSALVLALEGGEADVICATFGVTPERARRVAYSRPYFGTAIAVVCRAPDAGGGPGYDEPRLLADLAGRPVAAAIATTSERAVRQHLPLAVLVLENKDDRSTDERLLKREIDAAVMDGPAADALVAESGGRLVRLDETLGAELYALAVPLGRVELLAELDDALESLERSGRMLALDARYGVVDER